MPSNPQNRAIVFDFGGVLMDWNPRHLYRKLVEDPEEIERFLEEVGFNDWNVEQDRGRPFTEGVALLGARFPHRAELIRAFHERWKETVTGPIEGTVEIARELRDAGYPLFGLSNWSAETFQLVREEQDFFDWFQDIVLSGEERVCKPEPEIYQILIRRSGRSPDDLVFIDDSAVNVTAARENGMDAIQFRSPGTLREELEKRGILA